MRKTRSALLPKAVATMISLYSNYLAAAEAAQGSRQLEQRDRYLQLESEQNESTLAVALTSAKLQIP